jgi:hypothetical protein
MPFTWEEPVSAGLIVFDSALSEIHDHLDSLVDNLACTVYYAQYLTDYDISIKTTNEIGVQAANDSGVLSVHDANDKAGHYITNLGSNYISNLASNYISDLASYDAGVLLSDHGSVATNDGSTYCPTHWTGFNTVNNDLTGCPSVCNPMGNLCGGDISYGCNGNVCYQDYTKDWCCSQDHPGWCDAYTL